MRRRVQRSKAIRGPWRTSPRGRHPNRRRILRRRRPSALGLERLEGRALLANSPPTGADITLSVLEDDAYTFTRLDFGFSDDDGNALLAVKVSTIQAQGSLTLAGAPVMDGASVPATQIDNGQLVYTPLANANGIGYASLAFQVQDDGGTTDGGENLDATPNTITFDVTAVNDAPVRSAGSLAAITVNEDGANAAAVTLGLSAVTYGPGGGADESSQTLTYTVTAIPTFITLFKADGTTQVTANTPVTATELQGLKYKTVANANGTGSVTWTVADNGGTTNGGDDTLTENLSVTVSNVNSAPRGADKTVTIDEDVIHTFTVADFGFQDPNDSPANAPLKVNVLSLPGAGIFTLSGVPVTIGQAIPVVAISGGNLRYSPTPDFNGSSYAWFEFKVQDDGRTANGGIDTDLAERTITFDVTPVNDPPVLTSAAPAPIAVDQDSKNATAVSLGLASLTYGPGGGPDEATQTLTYKVTLIPQFVKLFAADGTTPVLQDATLSSIVALQELTYKTVPGASGAGPVGWTVSDGSTSITQRLQMTVQADTTPPAAPQRPSLDPASDLGTPGDNKTSDSTPTLNVVASTDSASVTISLSNSTASPSVVTLNATRNTGTDTWQATPPAALPDGVWSVTARAKDSSNNESKSSEALALTINTARPAAPLVYLATSDDTGFSNIDGITNKATPTFVGSAPAGTAVNVFRRNITANGPVEPLGTLIADAKLAGQWTLPFDTKITTPFTDAAYEITATATDDNGNESLPGSLTIVVDTVRPNLQSLVPASAPLNAAVPSVAATFDEEVYGLVVADFELAVTANGIRRPLTLSGTATVSPNSPGATSDSDWTIGSLSRLTAASGSYSLNLNRARIDGGKTFAQDLAGNLLTFSTKTASWNTDTTAPTVLTMTATPTATPATTASPWNTSVARVDISFSENVTGVDTTDFSLTRDGAPASTTGMSLTGGNNTYRLGGLSTLTATDGTYTLTLKAAGSGIKDTAGTGNLFVTDASTTWRIDRTRPTATFATIPTPRATAIDSVAFEFAEPVSGVELTDFTLKRAGVVVPLPVAAALSPASGSASRFVLTGLAGATGADGVYTVEFNKDTGTKVVDAAGNQMATNPAPLAWTVDTRRPTATIALSPAGGLRNTAVASATVTFDMDVTGVTLGDFRLTRNGTVVPLTGVTVTATPVTQDRVYTLSNLSGVTAADGAYVLSLVAAGSDIAAKAAPFNPLQADASTSWTMDATPPTVALSLIRRIGTVSTVRALFSETVTGFVATSTSDVTIAGGAIGNARNGTLVGREFLFDVTPAPGNPIGPVTVTVKAAAAKDLAGNDNAVSADLRLIYDQTPPTVTLAAPTITNPSPFTVTATFSEPVSGLTADGIAVTNGAASTITKNGNAWTFNVTPGNAGPVTIAINAGAVRDNSDNANVASATARVTYDNSQPTVTLASLSGNPSSASVLSVAATFSEPVSGVKANSLSVTGGNVVGVTGSGANYTFQIRPTNDGQLDLTVAENKVTDAASNGNKASAPLSLRSDRTAPRVLSIGSPSATGNVTITLSEEVRGFDAQDFVLTRNGTALSLAGIRLQGPAGEAKTTWTLPLGALVAVGGTYKLQLAASRAGIVDLAGNALRDDSTSASTQLIKTFTIDKTPPRAAFTAIPPFTNVARDAVTLTFTEPVTGVDPAAFTLLLNGTPLGTLDTLNGVVIVPNGNPAASYSIEGLAAEQPADGRYSIQLAGLNSGIMDLGGNEYTGTVATAWTLDTTSPTASIQQIPAVARAPITSLQVKFSEAVTGFDISDVSLTRNQVAVPLTGATVSLSAPATSAFLITNLAPLTGARGAYALTVRSAGTRIIDAAGNELAAPVTLEWLNDGPQVPGLLTGSFGAVAPNPRTTSVSAIALNFTAGVTGVGPEDFSLTRTVNGVPTVVNIPGLTVTGSGGTRTVGGLEAATKAVGDYELRLKAAGSGIVGASGQPLAGDVVATWRMVAVPAAPTATIALDAPVSVGAARDAVTITFSKAVTGVKLSAFELYRNGARVNLTGTALAATSATTYRISGLAPLVAFMADYELRLVASGSGIVGNDGSTLQANAAVLWNQPVASLRAAFLGIDRVTTAPVAAAGLRFSEAVRGVDVRDFELTVDRNDGNGPQIVALRGVTVTGSGTAWTVTNLAALQNGPGTYRLRLSKANGDIRTALGASLAEDASVEWSLS